MTRLARLRCALLAAAATIGGCASLPDDAPVVEKLDADTGLTVARLGRPVEIFRETIIKDPAGRLAYLGPFETNQMGSRELYLWIAIPMPLTEADAPPVLEVNGDTLTLGTPGRKPDFAGLARSPYKIPTPWSAMYYYRIDQAVSKSLGAAKEITLRIVEPGRDGPVGTAFAATLGAGDTRLADFAARE